VPALAASGVEAVVSQATALWLKRGVDLSKLGPWKQVEDRSLLDLDFEWDVLADRHHPGQHHAAEKLV
jgi:hypothetical protein